MFVLLEKLAGVCVQALIDFLKHFVMFRGGAPVLVAFL